MIFWYPKLNLLIKPYSLCYPKGLIVPLFVTNEILLGAAKPLNTDEIHEFLRTFSNCYKYLL